MTFCVYGTQAIFPFSDRPCSTAGLHRHGWPPPLPGCGWLRLDAAGGSAAPLVSAKTLQGSGDPEGRSPQASPLPDWLRRTVHRRRSVRSGLL